MAAGAQRGNLGGDAPLLAQGHAAVDPAGRRGHLAAAGYRRIQVGASTSPSCMAGGADAAGARELVARIGRLAQSRWLSTLPQWIIKPHRAFIGSRLSPENARWSASAERAAAPIDLGPSARLRKLTLNVGNQCRLQAVRGVHLLGSRSNRQVDLGQKSSRSHAHFVFAFAEPLHKWLLGHNYIAVHNLHGMHEFLQ